MNAVRLETDAAGIAWIVFDDSGAKVNLFNAATVRQLDDILDQLLQHKPKGVVIISGKADTFIAGADIKELAQIRDAEHGAELSRAGHQVFGKLEQIGVPTVAAIHGACLGGGCELALACRYRVATGHPKTQIGLPETQLGIIPGWGGTQRLPRLIGLREALAIIVPGKTLDAARAWKTGLVDAVVPVVALRDTARAFATGKRSVHRKPAGWQAAWPARSMICLLARRQVLARTRGHYPAPLRAIDAVQRGLETRRLADGLDRETRIFSEIATTPECRNLIRVFFLRETHAKLRVEAAPSLGRITKVGVLGAGVMGAGIAQWCSARGITVRLKDIKPEYVASGMKRIAAAYREGVKRHKLSALEAEHGLARIHPTTEYSGFGDCDLVIEAVLEHLEVKRQLYRELTPLLRPTCVIASNTSAIPIDELAAVTGRPERFVGIHFFNPVHKMPLIEVVRGTATAGEVLATAVEFAKQLKKLVVVVKGAPGFLVNRLLMPYLNEAGVLLEEGVSVAAIDNAMLAFGMPMGPLRLVDEVGLDVAVDVARELADAFRDRMTVAPILDKLREAGLRGRKGGAGFYVYGRQGERLNPALADYVPGAKCTMAAAEIQRRLLGVMIAEARRVLAEGIVGHEDDIDAGMIFGTGFPPFRGGLVEYARDAGLWG